MEIYAHSHERDSMAKIFLRVKGSNAPGDSAETGKEAPLIAIRRKEIKSLPIVREQFILANRVSVKPSWQVSDDRRRICQNPELKNRELGLP